MRELLVVGEGLVPRACALAAGINPRWIRRQVETGALLIEYSDVLRLPESAWRLEQRFRAAVMHGGSDALLSHESALEVYGLLRDGTHESVHITVPRKVRNVQGVIVHSGPPQEQHTVNGLPVVGVKQALVGCVANLDPRQLRFPAIQAVQEGLLTAAELADMSGVPCTARKVMREIGEEALAGAESGGEANAFRLFVQSRLPRPELQVKVMTHQGAKRVDGYWERYRLAYEVDGREYHTRVDDFERQPRRRNAIHAERVVVIEFTVHQIMQEEASVLADAEANLLARAADLGLPSPFRRR